MTHFVVFFAFTACAFGILLTLTWLNDKFVPRVPKRITKMLEGWFA